MSCRKVTGVYRRRRGIQWWVVMCPYCKVNHWINLGGYMEPLPYIGQHSGHVVKMPCGSSVEIRPTEAALKRIEKLFEKSSTTDCTE